MRRSLVRLGVAMLAVCMLAGVVAAYGSSKSPTARAASVPGVTATSITFGGENGLVINPPTPPSWLGANFALEQWNAWIACLGALIVLFAL